MPIDRFTHWFYGYIDAYGAVHGKEYHSDSDGDGTHTEAQLMTGKTWRWSPSEGFQNFRLMNPPKLETDDYYAIARWLVKNGVSEDHWSLARLL